MKCQIDNNILERSYSGCDLLMNECLASFLLKEHDSMVNGQLLQNDV